MMWFETSLSAAEIDYLKNTSTMQECSHYHLGEGERCGLKTGATSLPKTFVERMHRSYGIFFFLTDFIIC